MTSRAAFLYESKSSATISFGWWADFDKKGEFWTDDLNKKELNRIMNFLINSSDEDWKLSIERYMKDIMTFDPRNTKFTSLMKQIEVELK